MRSRKVSNVGRRSDGWPKIYYLELLVPVVVMSLSRWSRLHLQSLEPVNKEGLCPSTEDIKKLTMKKYIVNVRHKVSNFNNVFFHSQFSFSNFFEMCYCCVKWAKLRDKMFGYMPCKNLPFVKRDSSPKSRAHSQHYLSKSHIVVREHVLQLVSLLVTYIWGCSVVIQEATYDNRKSSHRSWKWLQKQILYDHKIGCFCSLTKIVIATF
jgi:hypothetical protein